MTEHDLQHKKMILEKIVQNYASQGPLPPIQELNSYISQMDPKELAQAIYMLEYNDCRGSFENVKKIDPRFKSSLFVSKDLKNSIEKIFMAVTEHFRRVPGEASPVVDQIFHYFYQTLVYLATRQGLISFN